MSDYILAIDQGTTGTTCLVVNMGSRESRSVKVEGRGYAEFPQYFPQPGWVEHDLNEIWDSTTHAVKGALETAGIKGEDIAAIGITNQRETTGLWDTSGNPVARAIVWQDRRTADTCEKLRNAGHLDMVKERTGLVLDPYFSGTKVAWLLNNVEGLRARANEGELRFGTMDTWLIWKLTQGKAHVTDATNASRTLLYDIHQNQWDEELCGILGEIPSTLLAEVCDSSHVYGTTEGVSVLPDGIPIAGIAGDQQSSLFGQACFEEGMAKCTYGTGAFALMNTGSRAVPSENGMLTTIAWRLGGRTTYAIEGSTFIAGAVVQWLRDGLQFFKSSSEIEALAASVEDNGGVILVPALTGLGAPHWRPEARGLLCGLTRGTTRGHIARAALEGIAYQVNDLLGARGEDSGKSIEVLRVDGGATANNFLMQFQSDLLGISLHRPEVLDTTALGAAYLAALGVGIFSDLSEVTRAWALEREFTSEVSREVVADQVTQWRAAVERA